MIPSTVHRIDLSGRSRRLKTKAGERQEKVLSGYAFEDWDTDRLMKEDMPSGIREILSSRSPEKAMAYIAPYLLNRYGGIVMDALCLPADGIKEMSPVGLCLFRAFSKERAENSSELINIYGTALTDGAVPGSGIHSVFMAGEKGHPLLERMMETTERNSSLIRHEKHLTAEDVLAMAARSWGLRYRDEMQVLTFGVIVYPSAYFPFSSSLLRPGSIGLSLKGDPWAREGAFSAMRRMNRELSAFDAFISNSFVSEKEALPPAPEKKDGPAEPESIFEMAGRTEDEVPLEEEAAEE